MRLLVIEDDSRLVGLLTLTLEHEGFKLLLAEDGEEGLDLAKHYEHDAILLGLDAHALRALRRAKVNSPLIMLSDDGSVAAKVAALTAGADDYLVKPFHKEELICRLRAVIRRAKGHAAGGIEIGDLTLDLHRKLLLVRGRPLHLTGKEYQMMEFMALRLGRMVSKYDLFGELYDGRDDKPELKIIDVYICKLRRKLREAEVRLGRIDTLWGRGYVLRATATATASAEQAA